MAASLGPLEEINRAIRENRIDDYPPTNRALGMRPLEFGPGTSKWRWSDQPAQALNPFGTIQGGFVSVFVDEMFSTAIGSVLDAGEWATTAEMKLSYLRALLPGAIEGSARVVRRTRTIAFVEATVMTKDGEPAVVASSTWAIQRK
ncbi:MAG: PaaI family thioesterase [Candidatus Binataceae bacterium]